MKELEMVYADDNYDKNELELVRFILMMKKKFGHFKNMSDKIPAYFSRCVERSSLYRNADV